MVNPQFRWLRRFRSNVATRWKSGGGMGFSVREAILGTQQNFGHSANKDMEYIYIIYCNIYIYI